MGCSGKSIGCKSAALSPVALHLVPAPKLKCIIPTFQRQLLTPTSIYAPRIFLFTQSSPWNILNFVDTWKRAFCILPFSGPPVLPRTISFYTQIISRIRSFCLHPVPGIPGEVRIICLLCLHDSFIWTFGQKGKSFLSPEAQSFCSGPSLVVQWLRIYLPMQGTWVHSLVQEDPMCHKATKPVHHNYQAQAPRACPPQQKKSLQWEAHVPQWRVVPARRN